MRRLERSTSRGGRGRAAWGAGALVLLALAAGASPARAHAHLQAAEPAAGARVQQPPRVLRLTFSEAPELAETTIRLLAADGSEIPLGAPTRDGARVLVVSIPGKLAPGEYRVLWRVAAADGHPARGQYSFTVLGVAASPAAGPGGAAPASAGAGATAGMAGMTHQGAAPAAPPEHAPRHAPVEEPSGASSPTFVVIRAGLYSALVALLGAVAFGLLVLGRLGTRRVGAAAESAMARTAANIGLVASVGLLLVDVFRLIAESAVLHGAGAALDPGRLAILVGYTVWGRAWLLQVVAAMGALAGCLWLRRGVRGAAGGRSAWASTALAAVALAFAQALSGHAASSPEMPALAVGADALHVLAAGGWLGSLAVTMLAGIPAALAAEQSQRGRLVAEVIRAFSPVALTSAALLALTGLIAAVLHLGTLGALAGSSYGRTLLLKLALVALVLAAGGYNWLRVKPSLGTEAAAFHLVRSATLELVVGFLVLVVTAVLVALPTPV